MGLGDRMRQGFYTLIFVFFAGYTAKMYDFNPYPKVLNSVHRQQWRKAAVPIDKLQDGDLLLRHSKGFVSDAILTFSTNDPQYSHSGIIKREGKQTYVYHATGGEENVSQKMKKDEISLYCHPAAVFKFGIYRWDLSEEERKAFMAQMEAYYEQEVEFDLDFDMETEDKMYCSEMIYRALILATNDENFIPLSKVLDKPYVAIDNLYLNDHCNLIFDYNYD